ncbi:MAG: 50S ribosomal protein L1 [Parcubacteria group bacterium]|nr:MAG: 50S ribosomal protein L1 [Parcubacteria group bacterium]
MAKTSKRMKNAKAKLEPGKLYKIDEAIKLVKETSTVKFDASVEVHANLGIDTKKGDQLVRGSVALPHGSGQIVRVAAFVPEALAKVAKEAGADLVGGDELIEEIKKTGKCDFDIAVTVPDMMKSMAGVARILGQKGLMPNPKTGTIGPDVKKMVSELKKGKISFKNDANANIHLTIGKVSFEDKVLLENFQAIFDALKKSKPSGVKGTFIKTMTITSSMGPGIKIAF